MVAQDPEVERVLANPAIKKALCRDAGRPLLAAQDPPGVLARLPFPYPDRLSGGQHGLQLRQPEPPTDEGCGKDLDAGSRERPPNHDNRVERPPLLMSASAAGLPANPDGAVTPQISLKTLRQLPNTTVSLSGSRPRS